MWTLAQNEKESTLMRKSKMGNDRGSHAPRIGFCSKVPSCLANKLSENSLCCVGQYLLKFASLRPHPYSLMTNFPASSKPTNKYAKNLRRPNRPTSESRWAVGSGSARAMAASRASSRGRQAACSFSCSSRHALYLAKHT